MRNNFNNVVKFFYNTKVDNKSEFRKRNEGKFEKLCAKAGKHKKKVATKLQPFKYSIF